MASLIRPTSKQKQILFVVIYIDIRHRSAEEVSRIIKYFNTMMRNWETKLEDIILLDLLYPCDGDAKVDVSYFGNTTPSDESFLKNLRQKLQNDLTINDKANFFES